MSLLVKSSKRFDRCGETRIPYASAMTMLGAEDGILGADPQYGRSSAQPRVSPDVEGLEAGADDGLASFFWRVL